MYWQKTKQTSGLTICNAEIALYSILSTVTVCELGSLKSPTTRMFAHQHALLVNIYYMETSKPSYWRRNHL